MYNYKSLEIINDKASFYSKECWNKDLEVRVLVNDKLKVTEAWYYSMIKDGSKFIELNPNYIDYNEYLLDDLLLHELTHCYCESIGQKKGDGTTFFEHELRRVGATSTKTIRFENGIWLYENREIEFYCRKCKNKVKINIFDIEYPHNFNYRRNFECCGAKMYFNTVIRWEEEFKPNHKLLALNNKYKEYYKNNLGISA
jgi:predicted SprT family Zn-dependent metalloprotease